LVQGFSLDPSEALILLSEWNRTCEPPWSEKELLHKVESAAKAVGDREPGYLAKAKESEWDSYDLPVYSEPPPEEVLIRRPVLAIDNTKLKLSEEELERIAIMEESSPDGHAFMQTAEGMYRLTIPNYGILIEIDRLRREQNELIGEMVVKCGLPGVRSFDGALSVGDLNVSSVRARMDRAKMLHTRTNFGPKEDWIDWIGLIEEFCQRVIIKEREGVAPINLRDLDLTDTSGTIKLPGITLPLRHPTIVFGDGGSAKSYIALYFAGLLAKMGMKVAVFDWELAGEDHRERLELLFPDGMPDITYARCERALIHEVDRLRRIVKDQGVEYCFYDSIAFACSGPPESAEIAGAYFRAVRQIGGGSLHVAHVSKAEGADQKPFGCYVEGTEVLTDSGWVPHNQVDASSMVACFDLDTEEVRFENPIHIHEYDYEGDIVEIKGASVNVGVTPNHNMIVKSPKHTGGWTGWRKRKAEDLNASQFKIPVSGKFNHGSVHPSKYFAMFLGWWIAEGCLDKNAPVLTQAIGDIESQMVESVEYLGYEYNKWVGKTEGRENELPCMQLRLRNASSLGKWLRVNAGEGFANKHIPSWVFSWDRRSLQYLFDSMVEGDGSWRKTGLSGKYFTSSPRLADDFQRLCTIMGYHSTLKAKDNRFTINFTSRKELVVRNDGKRKKMLSSRHYNGKVYCLTVSTGAYITRMNGFVAISGNSAFWHNGARATWYIKASEEANSENVLEVGLFNRKANLARLQKPVGFRVEFVDWQTIITPTNVADTPELAEKMSLSMRIREVLKKGAMTAEEIMVATGAPLKRINETAKRNTKLFVVEGGKIANLYRGQ
jgi:hypothetical protein